MATLSAALAISVFLYLRPGPAPGAIGRRVPQCGYTGPRRPLQARRGREGAQACGWAEAAGLFGLISWPRQQPAKFTQLGHRRFHRVRLFKWLWHAAAQGLGPAGGLLPFQRLRPAAGGDVFRRGLLISSSPAEDEERPGPGRPGPSAAAGPSRPAAGPALCNACPQPAATVTPVRHKGNFGK